MSEKEGNYFGKRKPTGKLVGGFYVSKEDTTSKIKIEHKSGDFNFRIWCGITLEEFYNRMTKSKVSESYGVIFAGIKTFVIASIQNPQFFLDYLNWVKEWAEINAAEYTDEKDAGDLKKVKDDKLGLDGGVNGDGSGSNGAAEE